eukprot:GHVL01014271.1.p1 GENE.GHVL01014271.1~~GHVL01014271.1.p1  ORF type:complete len:528 (+),score=149.41 GHVL01014271.1:130-1713(+)
MDAKQEDVFNICARPVIEDVIKGINGTIFAYGQTGSGKTFTITGGAEKYADRGLIPRSISYIFNDCTKRGTATYKVYVSYLEIYNECGYDLLSQEKETKRLEDLPKVRIREDEDGMLHLRNLSVNIAANEEEALNLLFLGDTNRIVAETPMNDASTRSHCIFIIWIETTIIGSDTVQRAKFHLVDLAGSERVGKSGVGGNLLKEARYINLSLHYLEQVIVALHDKEAGKRVHVPYRNSLMTQVLRDSLGGNCKTLMIGAMACDASCVDESVSTCRFAAAVSKIKNKAHVNEELDPYLKIKRLNEEILNLKSELNILKGDDENCESILPEEEKKIERGVEDFIENKDSTPGGSNLLSNFKIIKFAFTYLRSLVWKGTNPMMTETSDKIKTDDKIITDDKIKTNDQNNDIKNLELQLRQRDNEISILVRMLSKRSKNSTKPSDENNNHETAVKVETAVTAETVIEENKKRSEDKLICEKKQSNEKKIISQIQTDDKPIKRQESSFDELELLRDRAKAFEVFRKNFSQVK